MRKTISSLCLIFGFTILVSTASAGINITGAEAIYEVNFSSVDVSTSPTRVNEIFLHLEEATFRKNLSSVNVPTEPSPVSEIFLHLEEAKTYGDLIVPIELINGTTSPIISDVTVTNITVDSATIKWNTDEVADSLVKYGKVSVSYTENKGDPLFVTNHTILLTGLQSGTTYYFVVNSADQSENSAQSTEFSFTTVSGIKGDLNSDGILTPADAAIALRLAASGAHNPAADVSGDDRVTSLDALMILQAAAGSIEL